MSCYFERSYYTSYFDICEEVVVVPPGSGGGGGWPVPGYPKAQLVIPELMPLPLELAYEIRIIERDIDGNIVTFTITPILL